MNQTTEIRRSASLVLITVLVFVFSAPLYGQSDGDVAIMPVADETGQFSSKTLEQSTAYLRTTLLETGAYRIVDLQRQRRALAGLTTNDGPNRYADCREPDCQLPLGKALAAQQLLRSKITKFNQCIFQIERIDISKEATVDAEKTRFDCSPKGLKNAVEAAVVNLTGTTPEALETSSQNADSDWSPNKTDDVLVKFESQPAASVTVDGSLRCEKTPCSTLVKPGPHVVQMNKNGFKARAATVEISKGMQLKWRLIPTTGKLVVKSKKRNVSIKIDGLRSGQLTFKQRLKPGSYRVTLESPCLKDITRTVDLDIGQTRRLKLNPPAVTKRVSIHTSDVSGSRVKATVWADGARIGKAPGTLDIPICTEKLTAKYWDATAEVKNPNLEKNKQIDMRLESREQPQVDAGDNVSCHTTEDHSITCRSYGMLSKSILHNGPPLRTYIDVSLSAIQGCGLTVKRQVFCWGDSDFKPKGRFRQIHSSGYARYHCGVTFKGNIKCWNARDIIIEQNSGHYTDVRAMRHRMCAIERNGNAKCWTKHGNSAYDATLESFSSDSTKSPVPTGHYRDFAEGYALYGLKEDNKLVLIEPPVLMQDPHTPSSQFKQISGGLRYTCGLKPNGSLVCWEEHRGGLEKVRKPGPYRDISAGQSNICAVNQHGGVLCWSRLDLLR